MLIDESPRVGAEQRYISLRKIIDFIEQKKLYNRMTNVVAKLNKLPSSFRSSYIGKKDQPTPTA